MKPKILLCDDEVHILRAAEFKLVRSGFDVTCASDGQEAWEIIERGAPEKPGKRCGCGRQVLQDALAHGRKARTKRWRSFIGRHPCRSDSPRRHEST